MKRHVDKLEFYITNTCNLTCTNCNRFNNLDFRGWQRWSDYAVDYQEWAEYIEPDHIVILGGEPFLNPTLNEWVSGLNQAFKRPVQILTNGTRLHKNLDFYDVILTSNQQLGVNSWKNWIGVSVHNSLDIDKYIQHIRLFLKHPITETTGIGADYTFVDRNGIQIRVWVQDQFYQSSIKQQSTQWVNGQPQLGRYTLHNNDPFFAHQACGFATWKNYHMIRGRLHKCGPVALMPEFDQQHNLDISADDKRLLHSYQPLSAWDYHTKGEEFFSELDNQLPQCKFCPTLEQMTTQQIFALQKKKNSTSSIG
jgi:organic radical activating enzyme